MSIFSFSSAFKQLPVSTFSMQNMSYSRFFFRLNFVFMQIIFHLQKNNNVKSKKIITNNFVAVVIIMHFSSFHLSLSFVDFA